jgi:circadian clock protein KaiB
MADDEPVDRTELFERLSGQSQTQHYVLSLYVTGMTERSRQAIESIRRLCEEHLQGRYELEVFDISQQPEVARREQLVAAPTLIKRLPLPLRRLIGDLSDEDRVLVGLNIRGK